MNLASLIISSLSLVAVVLIGLRSIRLGERSTKSAEASTAASEAAAKATELSAIASERAAKGSERAAAVAEQDARYRRIERALDAALEMRELFNRQMLSDPGHERKGLMQPEILGRVALKRKLEGRLAPFEVGFDSLAPVRDLATARVEMWSTGTLEAAIQLLKALLRSTADMNRAGQPSS